MECINHSGVQAAGTCVICGSGLCSSCVTRFDSTICARCLLKHNDAVERKCYIELGMTAAIFIACFIMYLFSENGKIDAFIFLAILITGAYWGRAALASSGIPSGIAVDMKTYGFISLIKLFFAIIFGILFTPFAIYKRIREVMKVRQARKDIAMNNN